MARPKIPDEKREDVRRMSESGLIPAAIASELEISVSSVYAILNELGAPATRQYAKTSRRKLTEDEIEEFIYRYNDMEPILDLLVEFDLTHTQMYMMLQERGITPRSRQNHNVAARQAALDHAVSLYAETNMTLREILDETGIHQPILHAEVHRRGIPLRRGTPRQPQSQAKAEREVDNV